MNKCLMRWNSWLKYDLFILSHCNLKEISQVQTIRESYSSYLEQVALEYMVKWTF